MTAPLKFMLTEACDPCRCGSRLVNIVRRINSNQSVSYLGKCAECNNVNIRGAFSHSLIQSLMTDEQIMETPIIQDNRCYQCSGDGCEFCVQDECRVCGSHYRVEHHHWWPQSMRTAEMNEGWYKFTDPLCRECHTQWHNHITPHLTRNHR